MIITFHDAADEAELQSLISRATDAHQRDRCRAALLAARGHETQAIIDTLARSRGFVQRWAYAYRDGGPRALRAKPRGGSRARLDPRQQERLRQRLLAGPQADRDRGVCTLRGKDVQRILTQEFHQRYSLGGTYGLLHRMGFSCLRPRPRHKKNNPEAMEEFKTSAPFLSRA